MLTQTNNNQTLKFIFIYGLLFITIFSLTAHYSTGYHHPDEHFQILEMASYKVGYPATELSDLAWEFKSQIRPGLQVIMTAGFFKFCDAVGISDHFLVVEILRYLSALFYLLCVFLLYRVIRGGFTNTVSHHLYWCTAILLWFIPYCSVRYSSENWSAISFIIGLSIYLRAGCRHWLLIFFAGLLLGLSFEFRYQVGIMVFGFVMWLIFLQGAIKKPELYIMISGVLFAILIGTLADFWFYNQWVFAPWNYLKVNIIEHKADSFGTSPWYFYFATIIKSGNIIIGVFILLLVPFLMIRKFKHPLTWIIIPFLALHIMLSHKELRFLFPIIPFMPWVVVLFFTDTWLKWLQIKWVYFLLLAVNTLPLLHIMFSPAQMEVRTMSYFYHHKLAPDFKYFYLNEHKYYVWVLAHTYYYPNSGSYLMGHLTNKNQIRDSLQSAGLILLRDRTPNFHLNATNVKDSMIDATYPPALLRRVNLNNWLARTSLNYIYLIEKKAK